MSATRSRTINQIASLHEVGRLECLQQMLRMIDEALPPSVERMPDDLAAIKRVSFALAREQVAILIQGELDTTLARIKRLEQRDRPETWDIPSDI